MADATTPQTDDVDVLDEFLPPTTLKIRSANGAVNTYLVNETNGGEEYWAWLGRLTALQTQAAAGDAAAQAKANSDLQVLMAELIEQCMTLNGKPVPKQTALGWGQSTRMKAFEACCHKNGMDRGAVTREGKDSGGGASSTTGTASPPALDGASPAPAAS